MKSGMTKIASFCEWLSPTAPLLQPDIRKVRNSAEVDKVANKLKCLSLCPQGILVFNIEAYIKFFFFL